MRRCNNCFEKYDENLSKCPFCEYKAGDPAEELYHLFPGVELGGRYIVGKVLGFGGFGITYKAWDKKFDTVVAIKEYYPTGLVNRVPGTKDVILYVKSRVEEYQNGVTRFLEEARSMAKFSSHENIVNVFDFFEENGTAYIVMEFLDGVSLLSFLKDNDLDYDTSIHIIRNVCKALKDIHKSGIIHRDVSPDNIFLCLDGRVKLIDFGAARFSQGEDKNLTIILKPGYAPPEQYDTINKQGPWSDVYALGATLYIMLTKIKPQESTNRKVKDELFKPKDVVPELSENVSNAILKAMSIEIPLRFASIEEFEKAIIGEKKIIPLEKEKKKRKRRRLGGILAATAILGTAFGVFLFNWNKEKEANTLPDADIILWYALTGNEAIDSGKESAFESIVKEFTESFPNVTITYKGVAKETYSIDVQNTIQNNEELHIFESTYLESELLNNIAIGVYDAVKNIDGVKYLSFKDYKNIFENQNQIPMGINVPAIYVNKSVAVAEENVVVELDELLEVEDVYYDIAVHMDMKQAFIMLFGEDALQNNNVHVVETLDEFIEKEYAFYFSSTKEHLDVQTVLPARYQILPLDKKDIPVQLTDLYSVSNISNKDEKKVAMSFLEFMLSDNSQDYLYIRNQDGTNPINKDVLEVLQSVYQELEGFFDNTEEYMFQLD